MSDSDSEYKNKNAENYKASEYVRLEADFFADTYAKPASQTSDENIHHQRILLVVAMKHLALSGIVSELQLNLGENVTVLSASDHHSVQNLLKQKDIDVVLYNSDTGYSEESSILQALQSDGNFNINTTQILLKKYSPELQTWLQNSMRSKHIMKAINQLNELS